MNEKTYKKIFTKEGDVRMKAGMLILLTVMLCVAGCATTAQDQTMVTQMQMRIGELERQVDAKDQRISELEYRIKNGCFPPVYESINQTAYFYYFSDHKAKIAQIDLEIENIELKEQLAELKAKNV